MKRRGFAESQVLGTGGSAGIAAEPLGGLRRGTAPILGELKQRVHDSGHEKRRDEVFGGRRLGSGEVWCAGFGTERGPSRRVPSLPRTSVKVLD